MNLTEDLLNPLIRIGTGIICKVDKRDLAKVPMQGPLIMAANHIGSLEVPIMYTNLVPRKMRGFAKIESWDVPFVRYMFTAWEAIPVRRGEADTQAIRAGLAALKNNEILVIAPEGTRSGHGRLQRAHPGIVVFALRSGAPILPVAYHGTEHIKENIRKLKRTPFTIRVGNPFYLRSDSRKVSSEIRQEMADEIMYQISAMLPPDNRGVYADLENATENYLDFPADSRSNLVSVQGDQTGVI
jgi:1-acyl-sn-glycerol-3-phosphate acyltransferase